MSSLLYHVHRPTQVKEILKSYSVAPKIAIDKNIRALLLKGFEIKPENDFLESRKTLLVNSDCAIGLAAPKASQTDYFYKNADADEMIFVCIKEKECLKRLWVISLSNTEITLLFLAA